MLNRVKISVEIIREAECLPMVGAVHCKKSEKSITLGGTSRICVSCTMGYPSSKCLCPIFVLKQPYNHKFRAPNVTGALYG